MDDKVKFTRTIGNKGGAVGIGIPKQLVEYLELNNGDEVILIGDTGKHGKYIAFWKKETEEVKP